MEIQGGKMALRSDPIQFPGFQIPKKTCSQHYLASEKESGLKSTSRKQKQHQRNLQDSQPHIIQ